MASKRQPDPSSDHEAFKESISEYFETHINGVLIINPKKKVIFANPAAKALLGDDVLFKSLSIAYKEAETVDVSVIHPETESKLYLEAYAKKLTWEGEKAILITLNDVTMRTSVEERMKKLAHEVHNKNHELEESNLYLQNFSHAVAHDLKNPLQVIKTILEVLMGGDVHNPKELLERSMGSVDRMHGMIEDLLKFANNTKKLDSFEDVSLEDILKDVLCDLDHVIKEKKAKISWESLPRLNVSRSQIYQVLLNLIANALKFSQKKQKPQIKISCKKSQRSGSSKSEDQNIEIHQIAIEDNGIGIPEEYQQKIFLPFHRLHEEQFQGSGIGLATVKRIIALHGGHISVQSEPKHGSIFLITIPSKISQEDHAPVRKESRLPSAGIHTFTLENAFEDDAKLNAQILDKSPSGIRGITHDTNKKLEQGSFLELNPLERYVVRWVFKTDDNEVEFGAKMVQTKDHSENSD